MEYFCKDHNQLCCGFCICKLKGKGKGQHKDCNVCFIEDIKEEKKNSLKNNIQNLENLSKNIEETINKIKIILENVNKKKEDLKLEILNIFTKIRNILNERENELLLDIDKKSELIHLNDKFIKDGEKLPNKIKILLEKCKNAENEWNNDNKKINSLIINCLNIEQIIKEINFLNEKINNNENSKDMDLKFIYEDELNNIQDSIRKFGSITSNQIDNKEEVKTLIKLDNSSIIKDNNLIIYGLNNWKKNIRTQLLYKMSRDGNKFATFHKLCDNKGKTLILIKSSEGFVIGGFTPLDWNTISLWKNNNDTFLFSLTNKKIYKKTGDNRASIYCYEDFGPWFPYIGLRKDGKEEMNNGKFLYRIGDDIYFENINDIIPNDKKDRNFKVEEVEIYKISFNE